MEIRLYFDEDSTHSDVVFGLRSRGIDVLTAFEAEMTERKDWEQLDYATSAGRVLYSFNVGDFCRLHSECLAKGNSHFGIIIGRQQRYSVGDQVRRFS